MKHIKRKPLVSFRANEELQAVVDAAEPGDVQAKDSLLSEGVENLFVMVETKDRDFIQFFGYQGKDGNYFLPEPHPVVLYFHGAQVYLNHWQTNKDKVFEVLNARVQHAGNQLDAFYNFFAAATAYTTFLFNALEAFMNHIIPTDYVHIKPGQQGDVHQTKDKIQRHSSFEEKIKYVIPEAKGKKFHIDHSHKFETLKVLKEFRDEIIHTKAYGSVGANPYQKLFVMSLNFDHVAAIHAVRDYINYYEPNLIEDCGCGKDH